MSEERDVVENGDDVEDGEVSEDGDGVEEPQVLPNCSLERLLRYFLTH